MQKRKLIQILAVLQPEERKEFAEFLRSPLHTHRPKLAAMVDLMEQKLFARPDQQISSEDFYALIYPAKKYNANDLNRSISVIMRELKNYLSFLQYRNDKGAQYGYYVKEVGERKWPGGSIGAIREVRKRLNTEIEENPRQYLQQYELAFEEATYWVSNMPKKPGVLYQNSLDRLDEFYIVAKLKTMILAKNHDNAHNTLHDYRFEDIEPAKLARSVSSKRLTRLYYELFKLKNAQGSSENLLTFVETLRTEIPHYDREGVQIDEGQKLAKVDAEVLYGLALNHVRNLNAIESSTWVPVIHDIFDQAIRKGAFLQRGTLYDRLFIIHIHLLCVNSYLQLAEDFFEEYVSILRDNPDNTVSDYCQGFIFFSRGKMKKAWKLITNLKNRLNAKTDVVIISAARVVLCALWYEMGEYDSMVHEAHSFRTWAGREPSRSKARNAIDKHYCKLILALERIIRGPEGEKNTALLKLRKEVQNGRPNGKSILLDMIKKEMAKLK